MAIPVTDDFNRAALGANWTQIPGSAHSVVLLGDVVAEGGGTSAESAAFWNADTFDATQIAWAQISQTDGVDNSPDCGPIVLAATSGEAYYLLTVNGVANTAQIYRNNGGSYTTIGDPITVTFAVGNWYGLETDGAGNFSVYEGASIGAATEIATRADVGTVLTTGQPGIWFFRKFGQITEFHADNVGGAAVPTITDANTDEIIGQAESTTLTGTNFEAAQGTGTVKISPTDNIADANVVTQTVTAWADTSITFTADFVGTTVAEGATAYVFVTNNTGDSNSAGFSITRQDLTAPTLTGPAGTATGPTTADLVVSTNEAGGTLYWYVSTSATPPSDTDLKAGTGAVYSFNEAVGATGVQSDAATGLSAATQYFLHTLQTDSAGLDSDIATSSGFTTDALPTIDTSASFAEGLKEVTTGNLLANESNIRVDVWRNDTGANVLFNQAIAAIASGHLTFAHASLPAGVSLHIKAYPASVALPVAWDQTPA